MNIEKIKINKHYVWVDKDAEIKLNDYYFSKISNIIFRRKYGHWIENYDKKIYQKIIAASLELKLEGVPSYAEWLAVKEYPITKGGSMLMPSSFDLDQSNRQSGFIKGYQTAEKELFTEDDLRKAIEMARFGGKITTHYSEEEIIEKLKQSKK